MISKRFKLSLVPTLVFLAVLPILIGLGMWQLDRAEQKRRLQELYDSRMADTPVSIGEKLANAEDLRFHRVELDGYYDKDYNVLIDNRVHEGQVGYFVISPLRLPGSRTRVLVNRGWVPLGGDRSVLPNVTPPEGRQKIMGIATVPYAKVFRLAPPQEMKTGWRMVWQHMEMERYADVVPFPVQPVVVLLDGSSDGGGFVREWKRLDTGIAVHQGYAFQWFSMAVALVAIFLFMGLRRGKDDRGAGSDIAG